jgi:hypothetical protein
MEKDEIKDTEGKARGNSERMMDIMQSEIACELMICLEISLNVHGTRNRQCIYVINSHLDQRK